MSANARKDDPVLGLALTDDAATEYATRGAKARADRPHLRLVSPLRVEKASRGVFAVVVLGLLGIGMLGMLLINTQLAQGAFVVADLQAQQRVLAEQEAMLSEQVAAAAAPETLEAAARGLGMVPSERPVFLTVPDGKVLGKPKPARAAAMPADATVAEDASAPRDGDVLPAPLPADYDPAAADMETAAVPVETTTAQTTQTTGAKTGKKAKAANGKKATNAGATEDDMWQEVPVQIGTTDAALEAVPVR